MTEDLKQLAGFALKKAQEELVRTGNVIPTIMMREMDGAMQIIRLEGETGQILNDGKTKDAFFDAIREAVQEAHITAVIFAMDAWVGKQTEKGRALGDKEFLRRARQPATAVRDGLLDRCEAITINVQTPAGTLLVQQEYQRGVGGKLSILFGDRREEEVGPDQFTGRQKMYGDLRPDKLG